MGFDTCTSHVSNISTRNRTFPSSRKFFMPLSRQSLSLSLSFFIYATWYSFPGIFHSIRAPSLWKWGNWMWAPCLSCGLRALGPAGSGLQVLRQSLLTEINKCLLLTTYLQDPMVHWNSQLRPFATPLACNPLPLLHVDTSPYCTLQLIELRCRACSGLYS